MHCFFDMPFLDKNSAEQRKGNWSAIFFLCANDVLVSCNFQLGSGFVIAEEKLSPDNNLSKLFWECKDYIIATCQGITWTEKVDDICQVWLYFVQLTSC